MKRLTGPLGVLTEALAELFAPQVCSLCREGKAEDEAGLCADCLSSISPIGHPRCPVCALPFDGVGPSHPCSLCASRPPAFSASHAASTFEGSLKDAIHRMKYGGDFPLAKSLETLFLRSLETEFGPHPGFSSVVPVPCHPDTLRKRGFDLPALLARRAAKLFGAKWRPRALAKTRADARMAGISVKDRKRVGTGLYVYKEKVAGRVLLVDDVVTSTITVRAAARALKRAGADEIVVAALARTPAPPRWKL